MMGELFEGLKRNIVITSIIIFISAFFIHYNYIPYEKHIDTYECYVSSLSNYYHTYDCRYLKGNNIVKTTVYEAQDNYADCKYCNVERDGWPDTIIIEERTVLNSFVIAIITTLSAYFIIVACADSRIRR
jgi:hypothetical protein